MDFDKQHKLLVRKQALLEEQAAVARRFNVLLTCKSEDGNNDGDGAIENSKKTMKNLEAAIVQSRQPGAFKFHAKSRMVDEMEKSGVLGKLARDINRLEDLIVNVTGELKKMDDARQTALEAKTLPAVSGFKDWFARYGHPSEASLQVPGMRSEMIPHPKVYGGTSHHKAFRSVAVNVKKGRLTR